MSKPTVKVYPSGLRLIVQHMPNFKSVSTNVFVSVGSRDELPNEHGLSHFVEHMLFKGTKTRSAEDISSTLDGLGADINAYTSNDATCYWTKSIAANVEECIDVLSDMYFNTQFADEEFVKEQGVIIQEIHMRDDNPRSAMFDLARETFFAGTKLGHDIAGTVEDINSFKSSDIYNYIKKHYVAPKTIISFAGDITIEEAERLTQKYFENVFASRGGNLPPVIKDTDSGTKVIPPRAFVTKTKDTEQHNVTVFFPIINNVHPDKYIWAYIYEILAAGMSSRLFTNVREKQGLVYAISGGVALHDIGGYFYIWFSCTPENTPKVLKTIASEIKKFKLEGPTDEEMSKVRNQRHTQELFNAEQTQVMGTRNPTSLAEFNEIKTIDEFLSLINKVTREDVMRASGEFLNFDNIVVAAVGREVSIKPFDILK